MSKKKYIIRVIGDYKDGGEMEDWGEMDFNTIDEAIEYFGFKPSTKRNIQKCIAGQLDEVKGLIWKKIYYKGE